MNVVLLPEADQVLYEVAEYIEKMNTDGSGKRWLDKIRYFLASYARSNVKYSLCHNEDLALEGFSCITYNGWVFAFKIENGQLIVYQVIRGDILT